MDANLAKILQQELSAAAEAIAKKHGLKIVYNHCRYSATNCDHKIHFAEVGESGASKLDEENFKRYAFMHGLPETALGKTFVHPQGEFKITGYLPTKGKKFPIMIENVATGKKHTCGHGFIDQAGKKNW